MNLAALLFTAWVFNHREMLGEGSSSAILQVVIASFTVAYVSVKFYDIPIRKWLTARFMKKSAK